MPALDELGTAADNRLEKLEQVLGLRYRCLLKKRDDKMIRNDYGDEIAATPGFANFGKRWL